MTAGRRLPILPVLVGGLLGFIGGYFAGGAGRTASVAAPAPGTAAATPGAAVEELQRALERDPENPRLLTAFGNLLSDLGAAYRNRGEFRRAVPLFERAQKNDPKHWQSLLNLVLIHAYDLHDSAGAQKWLDELKRRYPEIPDLDRIQERISALRAS